MIDKIITCEGGGNNPAVAVPLVALGTQSGTIDVIDVSANAVAASFSVHSGTVRGLRWLGNSRLVSFSYNQVYDITFGELWFTITSFSFSKIFFFCVSLFFIYLTYKKISYFLVVIVDCLVCIIHLFLKLGWWALLSYWVQVVAQSSYIISLFIIIPCSDMHFIFCWTQVNEKAGGYINRLVVTCVRSGLNRTFRVLQKPERAPIRALRASSSGRLISNLKSCVVYVF